MSLELIKDYHYISRRIALKNSLYQSEEAPSWSEKALYYICLFFIVVILAGILTGFGQAAPIISAIVSLFPEVSIQIGYMALMVFSLYAIPWALVYIPDISNLFRNGWENFKNPSATHNQNSIALERAHNILSMFYRKSMKRSQNKGFHPSKKDALTHVGNILIKLAILDAVDDYMSSGKILSDYKTFYDNIAARDSFKLGFHLKQKCVEKSANESKIFENLLQETAELHLKQKAPKTEHSEYLKDYFDNVRSKPNNKFETNLAPLIELNGFQTENIVKFRKELLDVSPSSAYIATEYKQVSQKLWAIQCKVDENISYWSKTSEKLGTVLGFLNAAIANVSGTALAPLYIIATILMIYAVPNAILPFYLSLTLVSAFAASGFVSSYGITRKSIEKAFVNMANAILDIDKSQRRHKQFSYDGNILLKPFHYLWHLTKRHYSVVMALFISLAIASFNFLAGVTFAHILLNPSMIMHPTQVATFSIQSLASLHVFELAFGIIGFTFTVIAVAPLMICAWKNFIKANKLEHFTTQPTLAIAAALTSIVNTALMFRMMLRPGSPLDLFFGATPWVINIMTYVAPLCILVLGFALFYMGLQTMLNDRGRNMFEIYNETLALKADYNLSASLPEPKPDVGIANNGSSSSLNSDPAKLRSSGV